MKYFFSAAFAVLLGATHDARSAEKPNVLFIAVDDLNDWVGCLGGHPQARTPNLDRLARSGILFTNAHCAAASCNPSRTAIMTGMSPARTGLYTNTQPMRSILPDAKLLPSVLRDQGYTALGSGKILHYFIDARSWDTYYPEAKTENPFPRTLYPDKRPLSLPRSGAWQYVETDWGPLDVTDEEYGGDTLVAGWVGEQLSKEHDKPFFLACGLYRPHEPWFVPKKYFEPFPLESIKLPPGYRADDLDDLPPEGKRLGPNRYFAHIRKENQWKQGVQGYLASIHYSDAMLGRVLDALEKSKHKDSTIVVLWSDHGWHLGEKQHWQKFTAWRACTRVPMVVRVPEGCSAAMPAGTVPAKCDRPVNLLSLMPTLLELTGSPPRDLCDGPSLVPLLKDPKSDWDQVSVTHLDRPGSYGLSTEGWRYIHYADGGEELYDIEKDPYEWHNLATEPAAAEKLSEMRKRAPKSFAPLAQVMVRDLKLKGIGARVPASRPAGKPEPIEFVNESAKSVRIVWVSPTGGRKQYAKLATKKSYSIPVRKGAVWLVTDTDDRPLGFITATGEPSRVVIR